MYLDVIDKQKAIWTLDHTTKDDDENTEKDFSQNWSMWRTG